jgi:hypothetical protein
MKICVYTVLLGSYDALLDQPVAADSNADFVCFTDDPGLVSDTWRIELIEPVFPQDLHRSSRVYKILGHPVLDEYDVTVCIDASVRLRATPERIVEELLTDDVQMALVEHSYRDSVLDEFDEVVRLNYDDRSRVYEQLTDYAVHHPDALSAKPLWGGFLVRRRSPHVADAMRVWFDQVLRYSRRDQLSLPHALQSTRLPYRAVPLDNFSSHLHEWPVITNRKISLGKASTLASGPMVAEVQRSRRRIAELEQELRGQGEETVMTVRQENANLRVQIDQGTAERARLEAQLDALRRRMWENERVFARSRSISGSMRNLVSAVVHRLTRRRRPADE